MTDTITAGHNALADLRERLKVEHAAVSTALKHGVEHAMAAGDILIEAKDQLKHGQWLPWLETSGVSERTAQRYIRLGIADCCARAASGHAAAPPPSSVMNSRRFTRRLP
jgi:Protein of unknown function (DUF3102)